MRKHKINKLTDNVSNSMHARTTRPEIKKSNNNIVCGCFVSRLNNGNKSHSGTITINNCPCLMASVLFFGNFFWGRCSNLYYILGPDSPWDVLRTVCLMSSYFMFDWFVLLFCSAWYWRFEIAEKRNSVVAHCMRTSFRDRRMERWKQWIQLSSHFANKLLEQHHTAVTAHVCDNLRAHYS